MKLRIYNHQFLAEDYTWIYIVLEQLKLIEDVGLMDAVDRIDFTALGNETQRNLAKQLTSVYPKITVTEVNTDISGDFIRDNYAASVGSYITETPTIKRIWVDSQEEDFFCLYIHGKGASAFDKCFKAGNVPGFVNYYYWRKFLEWGCVEKWKECVNALETHEMAGCFFCDHPHPHFSGNIWWARSDYLRTLDDIDDSEWWRSVKQPYYTSRLIDEMLPGSKAKNFFNLHSPEKYCSPNPGLYSAKYERENYEQRIGVL